MDLANMSMKEKVDKLGKDSDMLEKILAELDRQIHLKGDCGLIGNLKRLIWNDYGLTVKTDWLGYDIFDLESQLDNRLS